MQSFPLKGMKKVSVQVLTPTCRTALKNQFFYPTKFLSIKKGDGQHVRCRLGKLKSADVAADVTWEDLSTRQMVKRQR